MAEEQVSERDQILAHFQKLDDAAGNRNPFEHANEEPAPADNSDPATSSDEPKEGEPKEEPNKEQQPEGDEQKGDDPTGDQPEGDEPAGDDPKGEQSKQGDSKYKKAKRGRERLDAIRQKAEADKAEAVRLREEAERRHAETKALIDQAVAQRRSQKDTDLTEGGRFNAEEFTRAGDWHEAEAEKAAEAGDLEKFHEHAANAKQCRRAAQHLAVQQRETASRKAAEDFARKYGAVAEAVIKDNPDLGVESELSSKMKALLESEPILTMIPDGFKKAFEILQLRELAGEVDALTPEKKKLYTDSGKVSGLLDRLIKAEAEVERLSKLTSLEKGDNTPVNPTTDWEKLSPEEQKEYFRKQALKADGVKG